MGYPSGKLILGVLSSRDYYQDEFIETPKLNMPQISLPKG